MHGRYPLRMDTKPSELRRPATAPRPLRPEERAALSAVLNYADFDGRDALLAQVDSARVVGYCGCGCATVLLAVESAAPASSSGSPIPNEATIIGADGDPLGGLLVFLEDGYLATLEVYSYDDPISPFPPMERLKLLRKSP